MAKNGRRLNHEGVITALPNFEVGAVGERKAHAEKHFVGGQGRHVDHFNAKILAAIENGRRHFGWHRDACDSSLQFFAYFRLLVSGPHACVIKTFSDSAVGRTAKSKAS